MALGIRDRLVLFYRAWGTVGFRTTISLTFGILPDRKNLPRFLKLGSGEARTFLLGLVELKSLGLKFAMSEDDVTIRYPEGDSVTCTKVDHPNLLNIVSMVYKHGGKVVDNTSTRPSVGRWFVLEDLPDGRVMICPGDVKLRTSSLGCPICVVETFLFKIHDVPALSNRTVIDIGAWVGDTALHFASLGASRIISLEPNLQNYSALKANLALNPLLSTHIETMDVAFGKDGVIQLFAPSQCGGDASIFHEGKGQDSQVRSISLEKLLMEKKVEDPYYLKMDAKGAEKYLGDPATLSRFEWIKIEYNCGLGKYSLEDLLKILRSAGFQVQIFREDPEYIESSEYGTIISQRALN
jgi:FkbM family methyltransferase